MIMVDTGFWLALANKQDQHHEKAELVLKEIDSPLITIWSVMTESCYLLLMRLGTHAQIAFIKSYRAGAFKTFELTEKHVERIHELLEKYENLPMDLADASLVILAEHLGHGKIFSTDTRDFNTYRWKNSKPFENLFLH